MRTLIQTKPAHVKGSKSRSGKQPAEVKIRGRKLGIPYDWYWRLAEATPEQLNNWRLVAGGQGISWEDLDEVLPSTT